MLTIFNIPNGLQAATNELSLETQSAMAINFVSQGDRHYVLQSSANLENPVWYDVGAAIKGNGQVQTFYQRTGTGGNSFFRVVEHDLNAGLVAHYPLDGNANDASGYQAHGYVLGPTLTKDRFGNQYGAYHFNGIDQFILIPHQQQHSLAGGDFTVAFWASFDVSKSASYLMGMSDGGGLANKWLCIHNGTAGTLAMQLVNAGGPVVGTAAPWQFTSNTWTHLTFTRSGQTYRTYINGRLMSEVQQTVPAVGSLADLTFGMVENLGWFQGSLDDLRIYNRALSLTEVGALPEVSSGNLSQGLVAHYEFNGDAGYDSVTGNEATVVDVALTEDEYGRPNQAGLFNGTTSVLRMPAAAATDSLNSEFTISMRVQFQGVAAEEQHLVGRSEGPFNNKKWLWLYRPSSSGALSFLVSSTPGVTSETAKIPWSYTTNAWYTLVLTKQGLNYTCYVNGVKSLQSTGPAILPVVNGALSLGSIEGVHMFSGKISDARLYSRMLDDSEIKALAELSE